MKQLPPDKGYMGDSKRGASLGRASHGAEHQAPIKFTLQRVRIDQGGYDSGGAYWGLGGPLYWACSDNCAVERFFRACGRAQAKGIIRAEFPGARFYN